jgi:hypothetical protein
MLDTVSVVADSQRAPTVPLLLTGLVCVSLYCFA